MREFPVKSMVFQSIAVDVSWEKWIYSNSASTWNWLQYQLIHSPDPKPFEHVASTIRRNIEIMSDESANAELLRNCKDQVFGEEFSLLVERSGTLPNQYQQKILCEANTMQSENINFKEGLPHDTKLEPQSTDVYMEREEKLEEQSTRRTKQVQPNENDNEVKEETETQETYQGEPVIKGPRGGKYIIIKGKKKHVPKRNSKKSPT